MEAGTFALIPIEVIQDRRLTLEQTRVLVALFSFRNKNTDTVWPSRAAISERTGMHPANISTATTALVGLGWLQKSGDGGRSKATRYTITVPDIESVAEQATVSNMETVAESATVAERATVAESATQTVADSARGPVADSARGIEHTNEHTSEQKKKPARFDALAHLVSVGVEESVAADWLTIRKAKKTPLTMTALSGVEREASKAGLSLPAAVRYCCEQGWAAFNAGWYADRVGRKPTAAQAKSDQSRDWLNRLTGRNENDAIDAPARLVG